MMNSQPKWIDLDADKRTALGKQIKDRIDDARRSMTELFDKMEEWRRFYENELPPKNFPWEGCSNINVPCTTWCVDTWHPHISSTILGVEPYTLIKPMESQDREKAPWYEAFLFNIESKVMNLPKELDMSFLDAVLNGTSIGKLTWVDDYRTVKRLQQVPNQFTGEIETVPVPVKETKYRGPKHDMVNLKNFVIWPLTTPDVASADLVGDRYRLTKDQVKRKIAQGEFDGEWAQSILDRPENELAPDEASQLIDDELQAQGIDRVDHDEFWFWEITTGYDIDGDGLQEDCVFVIESQTGTIVRATEFPYWHGRRYYISYRPYPRAGKFFGRSQPEIVSQVQKELNAVHNQRVDAVTQAMTKIFKYRRNSSLEPDMIVASPGAAIAVDSMDDLEEFRVSPDVPGIEIEMQMLDWVERISKITDLKLGVMNDTRKTATEVGMTSSEGGISFTATIDRMQAAMNELGEQVIGLCYQFMTDEEIAQIVGVKEVPLNIPPQQIAAMQMAGLPPPPPQMIPRLTREDLAKKFDFIPHGNTGTANKVQQRQEALMLYQTLAQNPLIMNDPKRIYRLVKDVLVSFGRNDVEAYLGTEADAEQMFAQMQQAQQMMQQMQTQQMQHEQQMDKIEVAQKAKEHEDEMALEGLKVGSAG